MLRRHSNGACHLGHLIPVLRIYNSIEKALGVVPVHSCNTRATLISFREVRLLSVLVWLFTSTRESLTLSEDLSFLVLIPICNQHQRLGNRERLRRHDSSASTRVPRLTDLSRHCLRDLPANRPAPFPTVARHCTTTRPAMTDRAQQRSLIEDIETRQDDVLQRLDDLNGRIEEVLRHELGSARQEAQASDPG